MKKNKHNYFTQYSCRDVLHKWKAIISLLPALLLCLSMQAQDCCDQGDKAVGFTFTYTGGACPGDNSQGSKSDCTGGAVNSSTVFIEATEKEDGSGDQYFSGNVSLGSSFSFDSGGDKFPSKLFIRVGNQINEIHASCSAPIVIGDQFGALRLDFSVFKNGVQCGPPPPPECDNVTDGGDISGDETNCGPFNPGLIRNIEDASGNSNTNGGGGGNGQDCCDQGDKPVELTFTYVGGACPGNNSQGSKSDCDGGAQNSATVFIEATEKEDGSGDQFFSGNVSLGSSFKLVPDGSKFPSKLFIRIGNQVNEIHASCSAPLITGETFGAIRLDNIVFKDGFVCGPPPEAPLSYQWISSTNGCPNNINQAIAGATNATYNPPTISQTTSYVRLARRQFCENDQVGVTEGWVPSNCVVKTVEVCDPCIGQGGDTDGDGVCNDQDCRPFNPNIPAAPGTPCSDGNPNTQNDVIQADGCSCLGTPVDPCIGQGGDTDGDGVCNDQDCQPFNPSLPTNPGTACNDGNPNTQNDVIQADGCSCAGVPTDPCANQGGDSDGDGICDDQDNCDFAFNPDQQDTDGDGIGDACDTPTDDCNGVIISGSASKINITGLTAPVVHIQVFNSNWVTVFNCSSGCDKPNQMISNLPSGTYRVKVKFYTASWSFICEKDVTITITGGDPCANQGGDTDGDGVCDHVDNCVYIPNAGQQDSDGDGIGDACDTVDPCANQGGDTDGDGVCDHVDNCVYISNPNQQDSDGDGIGDACDTVDPCANQGGDSDGDGVCDHVDNCVNVSNPSQQDTDGDGIGDACDTPSGDCDDVAVNVNATNDITVSGLSGPIVHVQVLNESWATVFNCSNNCDTPTEVISNLPAGNYRVFVKFYSSNWAPLCDKHFDVSIGGGGDPCANKGGDSDNDGVCDDEDNCPAIPNPYQEDANNNGVGDACDEPVTGDLCDNVRFNVGTSKITISGLHSSPVAMLLVFDQNWTTVFSCAGDCDDVETVSGLSAGVYYVKATLLKSDWRQICIKDAYLICGSQAAAVNQPNSELYFSAVRSDREISLNWALNSDFKTDYFVIEHSSDQVNFEAIKESESVTNAVDFVYYEDADIEPQQGLNYYRLKQYYLDGTFSYSPIREVDFSLDVNTLVLYPNPATKILNVNAKNLDHQDFVVEIVSVFGEVMLRQSYEKNSDSTLSYNLDQFSPGIYNLSIKFKDRKRISIPFVVVDF